MKDLRQYTIDALDTDIGRVRRFYFDDQTWTIRYIVVATGTILRGREVLISPGALRPRAWSPLHIRVNLTWRQVEDSPSVDLHKPISRQQEIEQHDHYGWPYYWKPEAITARPARGKASTAKTGASAKSRTKAHLRSSEELSGYHVSALDGEIGHVEDFLFDDKSWKIRWAIIHTKRWWAGKRVLISPHWIKRVSWKQHTIYANLSRDQIKKSPAWDVHQPVSRKYELQLHRHYGFAPYWTSPPNAADKSKSQ